MKRRARSRSARGCGVETRRQSGERVGIERQVWRETFGAQEPVEGRIAVGDAPAQIGEHRLFGRVDARRHQAFAARFERDVKAGRRAAPAARRKKGRHGGFVRRLVLGEAHVAIDAEDAALGLNAREPFVKARRGDQQARDKVFESRFDDRIEALAVRLEPRAVVVFFQTAQKRKRGRDVERAARLGRGTHRATETARRVRAHFSAATASHIRSAIASQPWARAAASPRAMRAGSNRSAARAASTNAAGSAPMQTMAA